MQLNVQSSDDEQAPSVGLDTLYEHTLILEDQLLCNRFQDKMREKYDKIISPFSVCLGHLWEATMDDKRARVTERGNLRCTILEFINN
jgi:hypothetical protein